MATGTINLSESDGGEKQKNTTKIIERMDSDPYYQIAKHPITGEIILSNSGVKAMFDKSNGKNQNRSTMERNFKFGNFCHTMILEPERFEQLHIPRESDRVMLERMAGALRREGFGWKDFWSFFQREKEFYGRIFGYSWKGKLDACFFPDKKHNLELVRCGAESNSYYYADSKVIDLKTTRAPTQSEFERACEQYGYDIQAFIYLNLSKAESMDFIGIQKSNAPMVYQINEIDRGHDFYKNGEKKLKHILKQLEPQLIKAA